MQNNQPKIVNGGDFPGGVFSIGGDFLGAIVSGEHCPFFGGEQLDRPGVYFLGIVDMFRKSFIKTL